MTRLSSGLLLLWPMLQVLGLAGCAFRDAVPSGTSLLCQQSADCPDGWVCMQGRGLCALETDPCVLVDGASVLATPVTDGSDCGGGSICVAGACVAPRCGDGVATGIETCDGEADCRADCTRCGDGVLNDDELCDGGGANSDEQPNACRTTCVPARCGDGVRDVGEGCDDGVGNSDDLAAACRTTCALPTCGDGVLDPGEVCDAGTSNSDALADACRTTCVTARCGDGVIDAGELCDNGAANSDVQPNACRTTCVLARCGDGTRDLGESCDDGALNDDAASGACRMKCVLPSCGDGVLDPGEVCDAGALNSDVLADACRTTCVAARCGDGVIDAAEVCDEGAANSDVQPNACRTTCVAARCGDGTRDLGEGCDDGLLNDDSAPGACRTTCALPTCGDGRVDPGEACDNGLANNNQAPNACRTTCVAASCGDGVIDAGEDCDNGAANSDVQPNTCRTNCVPHRCGDGVRDLGENCDDGILNDDTVPDACRTTCALPSCGDGVVDAVELCDDGNVESGDGCRDDCSKVEVCGDEEVDAGEACDDGNENPADGCDACGTQVWRHELVVSGSVEGREATNAALVLPSGVAVDILGRAYFVEDGNTFRREGHRVSRLERDGTIVTVAGNGLAGFSGDGGIATSAQLNSPYGVAVDALGRVYIADTENQRIRRVELDGTIATVAGTGVAGFAGDGGPATNARLNGPHGMALDDMGRLYVADFFNNRIRRIDLDGTIRTVAGPGVAGALGDGGPATNATLRWPAGVAVDAVGRLHIADTYNQRIRRVGLDGVITTVAGTGIEGFSGDGGPATSAALFRPAGVALDALGRIYIADDFNHRVRRVELDGTMTTTAGSGPTGAFVGRFSGDGGPATSARLNHPNGVAVDTLGRVYVAERMNHRVRRVDPDGTIVTAAGTGMWGSSGDGGFSSCAELDAPNGVAIDAAGRVYIADYSNNRIRRMELDGTMVTVAGTGYAGFFGDGGPATSAYLDYPQGIALDALGRVYIADTSNQRVRRVELDGTIVTVAGTGVRGYSGDAGPAEAADLGDPIDVAVDALGRVYIADANNSRIRRVDLDGTIVTVAGTGVFGFSGDNGPATSAQLGYTEGLALDSVGRVYIADTDNNRIRRIEPDGTIVTVAGTGAPGFFGDGGPATSAAIDFPFGVTLDAADRVYIADTVNHRIRRIDRDGIIETVAGNGEQGFLGDGGPATNARISSPEAVAVDAIGRMYFADTDNNRIRRVELDGTMTSVAGAVHPSGPGALGRAKLYTPSALVSLSLHRMLSVGAFARALLVDLNEGSVTVAVGYDDTSAPELRGLARFAPLLKDARGVASDPLHLELVITEFETGDLRRIGLDPNGDGEVDAPAQWTAVSVASSLVGPIGIAHDAATDTFIVAEEGNHCVSRVTRTGEVLETVYGTCGSQGRFPGYLNAPSHIVVSPMSGAVYVSDTGNHRVLRVHADDNATLVVGDGSVSSAGEGMPARLFPVHAPSQLALDGHGNLYVASTTTIRLVANVDGDADADGDDRVTTIFGGGDRLLFPESDAFCLNALTVDDAGSAYVADACQGYMVKISRAVAHR